MSKIELNNNKKNKKSGAIYFETTNNGYIQENKEVTVMNCGKDLIIKATSNKAKNIGQWRRTKDGYMENTITKQRKKIKVREEKTDGGITKTMTRLKGILRNNFDGSSNEIFVTLICKDMTTEIDTINSYFKSFFKKLKGIYAGLEYVYVLERHTKGDWHIHALIKDLKNKILYIENNEMEQLWSKGFTKTSRINDKQLMQEINEELAIDLRELKLNSVNDYTEELGIDRVVSYMTKKKTKEHFPNGKKMYYKSRGIRLPTVEKMIYEKAYKNARKGRHLRKAQGLRIKSSKTNCILNETKEQIWRKD